MLEPGVYPKREFNLPDVISGFLREVSPNDGAVASFIGLVKGVSDLGRDVSEIEVESYVEHATPTIRRICEEVRAKYGVSRVLIYHLMGRFEVGEPLVLVLVSGRSRSGVFPALQEAVERYKREPALFKKEVFVDGESRWVSHA
ncbi:MAG: molybdenum cofactor biosynthesis protein MoaE [Thaumarchaeota archaeon]|nr:molybdenum cofactor biosynthesis protein MoaE [Nitrososphaerota archaeon]